MPDTLCVTDTPHIKRYVFGTSRLREIQGASALLDHLNRRETEKVLREKLGAGNVQVIYFNGGSGQFIARGCEPHTVVGALREVEARYRRKTGGRAGISYGLADLGSHPYREALRIAHARMRACRSGTRRSEAVATFPLVLECESASDEPAIGCVGIDAIPRPEPDGDWVGAGTLAKRQAAIEARTEGIWKDLRDQLKRGFASSLEAEDDEEGAPLFGEGPVALVYADGDGMGDVIRGIETPEAFTRFARTVDEAVRSAFCAAVNAAFPPEEQEFAQRVPVIPLMLGGDDVLAYVRGDRALRFASALSRAFFEKTRDHTISIGMAVARKNQPFAALLEQAEELLKSAKKYRAKLRESQKDAAAPRTIDIHWSTASCLSSIEDARRGVEVDGYRRTIFPCTLTRLEKLMALSEDLRNGKNAMAGSGFQALFEAATARTKAEAELLAMEALGRCKRRKLIEEAIRDLGAPEGAAALPAQQPPPPWTAERKTFFADLLLVTKLGTAPEVRR